MIALISNKNNQLMEIKVTTLEGWRQTLTLLCLTFGVLFPHHFLCYFMAWWTAAISQQLFLLQRQKTLIAFLLNYYRNLYETISRTKQEEKYVTMVHYPKFLNVNLTNAEW